MGRLLEFICLECKKRFKTYLCGRKGVKYCSRSCCAKGLSGDGNPLYIPLLHTKEEVLCLCGCGGKTTKTILGRKKGFIKGHNFRGVKRPTEFSENLRKSRLGKNNPMYDIHLFGKDAPGYKNGNTNLYATIRNIYRSKKWVHRVFSRDNYTCQYCGKRSGNGKRVILNAHHIKSFSRIIIENNIKTPQKALKCEELWDINNGLTLCIECHNKTKGGENDHIGRK